MLKRSMYPDVRDSTSCSHIYLKVLIKEIMILIYYEDPEQRHGYLLFSPALAVGLVKLWQKGALAAGCEGLSKATSLSCFNGAWSFYFLTVREEFSVHAPSAFQIEWR